MKLAAALLGLAAVVASYLAHPIATVAALLLAAAVALSSGWRWGLAVLVASLLAAALGVRVDAAPRADEVGMR